MRWNAVIFIVCIGVLQGLQAAEQTLFTLGNDAYAKGDYAVAVQYYTRALKKEQSLALYGNLGNAYVRLDEMGLAIWNYERALTVDPRNPEVLANLHYARNLARVAVPEKAFIDAMSALLRFNQWCWLGAIAFWVFLFILGRYFFICRSFSWRWRFGLMISGLFLVCSILIFVHFQEIFSTGVVIAKTECQLKLSPTTSSSIVASLKSGELALIQDHSRSHYLIRLPNGKNGWIAEGCFKLIYDR